MQLASGESITLDGLTLHIDQKPIDIKPSNPLRLKEPNDLLNNQITLEDSKSQMTFQKH